MKNSDSLNERDFDNLSAKLQLFFEKTKSVHPLLLWSTLFVS